MPDGFISMLLVGVGLLLTRRPEGSWFGVAMIVIGGLAAASHLARSFTK